MPTFTHDFEDIELYYNNKNLLVSGSCEVSYTINSADPDVGIMSAFADDVHISSPQILLETLDEDDKEGELLITRGSILFTELHEHLDDDLQEAADDDIIDTEG